jgi:hypothetical protein
MKSKHHAVASRRRIDRLIRLAGAFRRAEAAIVRAFFAKPKPAKAHLVWLKAQGFKEYSAIKPIIGALTAFHPDIDRGIDRHAYAELTEKLADETKHARLVMDLLEEICGKKITPRDLTWLGEDRKLARARAKYSKSYAGLLHGSEKITGREIKRRDEALERAAITLTEGGGGALYQVCRNLRRNGVERKIAAVFREILRDEVGHKDSGGRALGTLITDENAFRRAAAIIREVCGQRLRMRNEQFGFPLAAAEVARLESQARRAMDAP